MSLPRRELDADIRLAARGNMSVLITGERGAGKKYIARLAHDWSQRREAPFVTVRCADLPDALLEFELFGRGGGSFSATTGDTTGWLERAQGGSLLLEEVGEISRRMQGRLLRFLESGVLEHPGHPPRAVDVRIIAATTQPLFERVAARRFLEGLYYCLNVIHLCIPPLRDRREEIPSLVGQLLRELAERHRIFVPQLAPEAMTCLQAYDWPGNVRELRDALESLLVSRHAAVIEPDDLPPGIVRPTRQGTPDPLTEPARAGRHRSAHATSGRG